MGRFDGSSYQARFDALAAEGVDVHGEARLVASYRPGTVLDAGCGTGRVAAELARLGIDVVGVEVDRSMLAEARRRPAASGAAIGGAGGGAAGRVTWVQADLAGLELNRRFDVVVLAGNVPLFCPAADRPALVSSCARHVDAGGVLVAGFQLDGRYDLSDWDAGCTDAGLVLEDRWSTWDRGPFGADGGRYAVSVHRRAP